MLSQAIFWVAVGCCIVAQVFITAGAVRFPRPGQILPERGSVPMPRRASEVAWTLVPAVVLAVVFLFTWRAITRAPSAGAPAPSAVAGSVT